MLRIVVLLLLALAPAVAPPLPVTAGSGCGLLPLKPLVPLRGAHPNPSAESHRAQPVGEKVGAELRPAADRSESPRMASGVKELCPAAFQATPQVDNSTP